QGRLTFPTQLERAGDFSKSNAFIRDPLRTGLCQATPVNPTAGADYQAGCFRDPVRATADNPQGLNIIPLNRVDSNGQKLLNIFPLPNNSGGNFNTVFQSTVNQPRREEILRMDWNISPKTTFYGRGIQSYEAFKGDFNFVLASDVW